MGSKNKTEIAIEKKVDIVERLLRNEIGYRKAAEEAGVHQTTIRDWAGLYEAEGATALLPVDKKIPYPKKTKEAAVKAYLAGQGSLREIAQQYNIRSASLLTHWLKIYNTHGSFEESGESNMSKARKTTVDERWKIVQDCLLSKQTYHEIAKKHQVSYPQVRYWVKKYEEAGSEGLEDRRGHRTGSLPGRTQEEQLRIDLAQEKKEKQQLQMEVDLLKKVKEYERRHRLD